MAVLKKNIDADSMVKLVSDMPTNQSTNKPTVYGNAIDLAAAQKYLPSDSYTFVNTENLNTPIAFRPGDVVVGGTGAIGGIAGDTGSALRLAGQNRAETEKAIQQYASQIVPQQQYVNQRMSIVRNALQGQYDQQQLALQQQLAQTLQALSQAQTTTNNQYTEAQRALEAQRQATLPTFQQQRNQADVAKAQNIQQLRNAMAQLGLLKGGDTVTGMVGIQTQRENTVNAANQSQDQYLTEMDNQQAALQSQHAAAISALQQQMAAAQQSASAQSQQLASQLAQQIAAEQMQAQLDYQDYLINRQDAQRQFDLQQAQLTGMYGGKPTLDAQQMAIQKALNEAQLTGIYGGQPTLEARQQAIQKALNEAQLTGIYNGQQTLDARQLAANIAAQQQQQALAQQEFSFNKWLQQEQLKLQKTQQSFENSLNKQRLELDKAAKEASINRPIGMNILQQTIQNALNSGSTPEDIKQAILASAKDWATRYGLDVDTMLDIFNSVTNQNLKNNSSDTSMLEGMLGGNPNTPSRSNTTTSLGGLSSGNASLDNMIVRAAQSAGIPANVLSALVKAESGYRQNAKSSAGAIGLTQLMPSTAKSLGVNPNNAWENLLGGARYLASQYKRFGDWRLALAAYNAGPGNVQKYGGVPPFKETQNYVKRIFGYLGWG